MSRRREYPALLEGGWAAVSGVWAVARTPRAVQLGPVAPRRQWRAVAHHSGGGGVVVSAYAGRGLRVVLLSLGSGVQLAKLGNNYGRMLGRCAN